MAEQLSSETGLDFTADEIVMTCGAGGALNVVLKTLLDPGDEVVIFSPFFVEYHFYADNHGGSCRVVPPDENFLPDMQALRNSLNERTRVVLINSPNNPTGVLYSAEVLDEICSLIREAEAEHGREIFLVSDEPYRRLLYDGLEYPHIFHHHQRSIVATSHSKDLALPGERIGYIATHPDYDDKSELADGLVFCNRTLGFVNAPALMQHIVRALQSVSVDIAEYQRKRDFLYDNLTQMGYNMVKPQGAFYMFPRLPRPTMWNSSPRFRNTRCLSCRAEASDCLAISAYRTAWTTTLWKARYPVLRRRSRLTASLISGELRPSSQSPLQQPESTLRAKSLRCL